MSFSNRETWSTDLYPESKERYWTLGENLGRIEESKQIKKDKKFGRTAEQRKKVAYARLGDIKDNPLLGWVVQKFPELAQVRFICPIFHARSHITIDFSFETVHAMQKWNSVQVGKLLKDIENAQNLISTGKLSTSATGVFRLGKRFVFLKIELLKYTFRKL